MQLRELRILKIVLLLSLFCAPQIFARSEIRIVGSSTIFPFASIVAEESARKFGMKTPIVEANGTGGGIKLFCQGRGMKSPDIAMASRRMTEAEKSICKQNGVDEIFEIEIGKDGIALISSAKKRLLSLSKKELYEAMAYALPSHQGRVKNTLKKWSDIDAKLPDEKIVVLGPPPSSGTRDAFLELIMVPFCHRQPDFEERSCTSFREDGGYVDAGENKNLIVRKISSNLKIYGLVSYSYLAQNEREIQAAAIDGVQPTLASIANGAYPISRTLYLYVNSAHVKKNPEIIQYLEEFLSDGASGMDGYLAEKGLVPVAGQRREKMRLRIKDILL